MKSVVVCAFLVGVAVGLGALFFLSPAPAGSPEQEETIDYTEAIASMELRINRISQNQKAIITTLRTIHPDRIAVKGTEEKGE